MLKEVLKNREFNSGDENKEGLRRSGMGSFLMKCLLHNWMSRLSWDIENVGGIILNK
jgi:anti-sigma regulatory factor (Ser/Thr protein kinase)